LSRGRDFADFDPASVCERRTRLGEFARVVEIVGADD
jgi:hypothetical protein